MKSSLKVTVVAGGYVSAFLAASAAVAIRMASTSGPDAQASGGMYAFGDSVVFVAVFGVLALVPTGGALYFLRPYRRFWIVLSRLCLAVAVTGLTAAILFAAGRHAAPPSPLATWAGLSVLQDIGCAAARAHLSGVRTLYTAPLTSARASRRNRHGGGP